MLEALLFGFTQGFVVGPVTLFGIREGLEHKQGFLYQMQVILGSACVDIIYLLLATAGAAQVVEFFWVRLIMWTAASYMLVVMGLNTFYERNHKFSFHHLHRRKLKLFETDFVRGFLITLFNPLSIVFWIMVAGSLYADLHTKIDPITFALVITFGTTVAASIVAVLTALLKKVFHAGLLKKLISVSSLILIGYGIWFFSKAVFEVMETIYR